MQPYFITRGRLDKETLEELGPYLFPPGFERFIKISIIFFVIMAVLLFILKAPQSSGVYFICAILIYVGNILCRKYCVSKVSTSGKKADSDKLEFDMHFYDVFFTAEGVEGRRPKINYRHIIRIAETETCYTLFTKGYLLFPVLKDSIEEGKEYEWLNFILENNHKILLEIIWEEG